MTHVRQKILNYMKPTKNCNDLGRGRKRKADGVSSCIGEEGERSRELIAGNEEMRLDNRCNGQRLAPWLH